MNTQTYGRPSDTPRESLTAVPPHWNSQRNETNTLLYSFFLGDSRILNFMCRLFGTLCPFHLHGWCKQEEFFLLIPPMKTEQTECSETWAHKFQTLGNHPKERIHHSKHGESLKSSIKTGLYSAQICSRIRVDRCIRRFCIRGWPRTEKKIENERNKRFISLKTRAKLERAVTLWNPAAQKRPVLDSSSFVPVLTLLRKLATILLLAFSLFELVVALSQCVCSESKKKNGEVGEYPQQAKIFFNK